MTVRAELIAVDALRVYLLRTLPAKVDAINAARAATMKAPRAGPYAIASGARLVLGTTIGSGTEVTLTEGAARTATEVAADITTAAIAGITASADTQGRLVVTASAAPAEDAPSVLWLGPDTQAGDNAPFGWGPAGAERIVSAIVAPTEDGISDGDPGEIDLGSGFHVIIGKRTSTPTDNIRRDVTLVTLSCSVFAAEPQGSIRASQEYISQCVRAVRECIYEDRTLDGAVHIAELPSVQYEGRTFRFQLGQSQSGLMSEAPLQVLIKVFERS